MVVVLAVRTKFVKCSEGMADERGSPNNSFFSGRNGMYISHFSLSHRLNDFVSHEYIVGFVYPLNRNLVASSLPNPSLGATFLLR